MSDKFSHRALKFFAAIIFALPSCYTFADAETHGVSKMDCRRNAATNITINLSSGVYTDKAQISTPLQIKLPANVDDKAYVDCLIRNQLLDQDGAERFLAKQDKCRTKTRILKATSSSDGTQIGQAQSIDEDFIACMDSDIGVEVLSPAN